MKEKNIALFGSSILEQPLLIDTDGLIDMQNDNIDNLLIQSMFKEMENGKTLLNVLDNNQLQSYLKLIFENQHSKKKSLGSLAMSEKNLNISFRNSEQNYNNYNKIKNDLKEYMKPSNETNIEKNPFEIKKQLKR